MANYALLFCNAQKVVFPIFLYKLGFHAKPPYRNALKKCVVTIFTLGYIKIHKIESLGSLKIKLEFYYGGDAWKPYLAPRLVYVKMAFYLKNLNLGNKGILAKNLIFYLQLKHYIRFWWNLARWLALIRYTIVPIFKTFHSRAHFFWMAE